jgi:putative SOS response-associated peptidase YedK
MFHVYCFEKQEDGDRFKQRFGGEKFDPSQRGEGRKQPYAIAMIDDGQMVMAGLWAKWKSPANNEQILSCTILTCGPNGVIGELHDRMPVILAESDWPKWLGEDCRTALS